MTKLVLDNSKAVLVPLPIAKTAVLNLEMTLNAEYMTALEQCHAANTVLANSPDNKVASRMATETAALIRWHKRPLLPTATLTDPATGKRFFRIQLGISGDV